jgi:hypothetical protein
MKTLQQIEDGFQNMSIPQFLACCAVAYGVLLVAGCIISTVCPFIVPGMR